MNQDITVKEIYSHLAFLLYSLKDAHLGLDFFGNKTLVKPKALPAIQCGYINDTLVVINSFQEQYDKHVGTKIFEINNISSKDLKNKHNSRYSFSDGYIKSREEYSFLHKFWKSYCLQESLKIGDTIQLLTSKGKIIDIPCIATEKAVEKTNNKQGVKNFNDSIINNNTAYLDINTFDLSEKDILDVSSFINSFGDSIVNLIIDVRANNGGDNEVLSEVYSFIAQNPFQTTISQSVSHQGEYKYASNFTTDNKMYEEYTFVENKGYVLKIKEKIKPSKSTNYKGNVIVLINSNSLSAASIFSALVKKNKRGTVIGRESGSCYYFFNALDFSKTILPNSNILVTIPLVKCVFDSIERKEQPIGRGVLPDINVPFNPMVLFNNYDEILLNAIEYSETTSQKKSIKYKFDFIYLVYILLGIILLLIIKY